MTISRKHSHLDERSRALHLLVAEKIRRDPVLFDKAKNTLKRWQTIVCISSQPYLKEWENLMEQGLDVCLNVAVEDSEYANALRQSSPFAGILSNQERFTFLKNWRQSHEA